jgi:hypothetical protein
LGASGGTMPNVAAMLADGVAQSGIAAAIFYEKMAHCFAGNTNLGGIAAFFGWPARHEQIGNAQRP